jgi:hypothetical protein
MSGNRNVPSEHSREIGKYRSYPLVRPQIFRAPRTHTAQNRPRCWSPPVQEVHISISEVVCGPIRWWWIQGALRHRRANGAMRLAVEAAGPRGARICHGWHSCVGNRTVFIGARPRTLGIWLAGVFREGCLARVGTRESKRCQRCESCFMVPVSTVCLRIRSFGQVGELKSTLWS